MIFVSKLPVEQSTLGFVCLLALCPHSLNLRLSKGNFIRNIISNTTVLFYFLSSRRLSQVLLNFQFIFVFYDPQIGLLVRPFRVGREESNSKDKVYETSNYSFPLIRGSLGNPFQVSRGPVPIGIVIRFLRHRISVSHNPRYFCTSLTYGKPTEVRTSVVL